MLRQNAGGAFTMTVNGTAQNDAPSGTDNTVTIDEDSPYVFTVADFGFSDVDGNNFTFFVVNGAPFPGTLLLDPDGAGPQPGGHRGPGGAAGPAAGPGPPSPRSPWTRRNR